MPDVTIAGWALLGASLLIAAAVAGLIAYRETSSVASALTVAAAVLAATTALAAVLLAQSDTRPPG